MTNLTGNARAEPRQRFARRGGRPQPAPDEDDRHRERSRDRGVHARDETVVFEHSLEIEGQDIEEEHEAILQPSETATLTVDLAAGSDEAYCPIGNDKGQGMELELTVR